MNINSGISVVILAAGLGTRMKSPLAKVLHTICGQPLIAHVVKTAMAVAGENVVVVVGYQAEQVAQAVRQVGQTHFAVQAQQLGTGHALLCALPQIPSTVEQVIVLCGDVPLVQASTLQALVADHCANHRDVTILAVDMVDPTGYGRMVFNNAGVLTAIIEEVDAGPAEKRINTINTGIYVIKRSFLESALPQLRSNNKQQEIYLTDLIGFGHQENRIMGAVLGPDSNEVIGVNSQMELQLAEKIMERKIREKS